MELVVRATVVFWFLWIVVRGSGKRSLSELTPLDLLLVVVIGDFVQQGVTQEDMSITGALVAVSVFVVWTLLADALGRRWPKAATVLAGDPIVVLRDGDPLIERLRRERVSLGDLEEAARMEGFGSLSDIAFGVLETDGRFSFVPKSAGTSGG
ncbi:MAG TPA: YetF domain-containing protein [Acidimicrobiia bacterium]|nr:YetF domain-containing protein [Acidimicrobiia bacterium]